MEMEEIEAILDKMIVQRTSISRCLEKIKDCLDAYLLKFERTCIAYHEAEDMWELTLVRFLKGKALECTSEWK